MHAWLWVILSGWQQHIQGIPEPGEPQRNRFSVRPARCSLVGMVAVCSPPALKGGKKTECKVGFYPLHAKSGLFSVCILWFNLREDGGDIALP